ncbi:MAG: hypothetical protein Q9220_001176 [cf. Caloplaca sp. 1 TL-2023]
MYRDAEDLLNETTGKEPRPYYENNNGDNVHWYEINFDSGVLEITKTTKMGDNNVGKPNDQDQGGSFTVDHIFELQIITSAFDAANRESNELAKKISDDAFKQARDIVNGEKSDDSCRAVAEKTMTNGKENVPLDPKWENYIPAVKDYISSTTDAVNQVIQQIGDEIGTLTNDPNVSPYFVDYGKARWRAGIDFLNGQTDAVINSAECRLTDECQEPVATSNDPSLEGINPACKCTCDGADTSLTDPRCQGFQGLSAPVCTTSNGHGPVADVQAIDKKLDDRSDGQQCCGKPECNTVESSGGASVQLCGDGCIGCARVANYVQGLIDHCTIVGNVAGKQSINEVPGLSIQI